MNHKLRRITAAILIIAAFAGPVAAVNAPYAEAQEGENLIKNPSFETGRFSNPAGWNKNTWKTNTAVFQYPVRGEDGKKAAKVQITKYLNGDSKWYFDEVPVTPGKSYRFTNRYLSTVPTNLTVQYRTTANVTQYKWIKTVPASSTWASTDATILVPDGVRALTVLHTIAAVGSLTLDEYALREISSDDPPPPPPPPTTVNLVLNPSLELETAEGLPQNWQRETWGTNTATFTYPVQGIDGERAARVEITSYSSGDSKWYFEEVPVTAGDAYRFTNQYSATVTTELTLQYRTSANTLLYQWLKTLPASAEWTPSEVTFVVPQDVIAVTMFHVINQVGSLTVDNYSLTKSSTSPSFEKGMVTFTFDDNLRSAYDNAIPILNRAGLKSTQYVVSERLDGSSSLYFTASEMIAMQSQGHEIAAHTRTHAHLTSLTPEEQASEIAGSRADLIALGASQVNSFAYPFGEYDDAVINQVKTAGFTSARTTDGGYNIKTSNPLKLEVKNVHSDVTLSDIQSWIDVAARDRSWMILVFHGVQESGGDYYTTTPAIIQGIADYISASPVEVVTMSQGAQKLGS